MIGSPISMDAWGEHGAWLVAWDVLGYDDYMKIVKPWCEENLSERVQFVASSCIATGGHDDALLLYMRFKQ